MKKKRTAANAGIQFAACAVAMAASVGGALAPAESQAVDSIERYCAASWRTAGIARQDWPDCTQQVFIELLERLSREQVPTAISDAQSEERRELNRSIWCITQRWRRAPRLYSLEPQGSAQPTARADALHRDEWDAVADAAAACLSDQQRKVVSLYAEGWTIQEIADELKLTTARASDEKYKAVQKLRRSLGKVG